MGRRAKGRRGASGPRRAWPFTGDFWANAPIPEAYVAALMLGGALHALAARPIAGDSRALRRGGLALVLSGLGLVGWAMAAARQVRIDRPNALLTHGPYAAGRNPMYTGWLLGCLGISMLTNSRWLLAATAAAGLYQHVQVIPQEEESLLAQFGDEYRAYQARTRRYFQV